MTRPEHIAPLDEALQQRYDDLDHAEKRQAMVHEANAVALASVKAVNQERMNAFYAIKRIEGAIEKLGYCLLRPSRLEGRGTRMNEPLENPADLASRRQRHETETTDEES